MECLSELDLSSAERLGSELVARLKRLQDAPPIPQWYRVSPHPAPRRVGGALPNPSKSHLEEKTPALASHEDEDTTRFFAEVYDPLCRELPDPPQVKGSPTIMTDQLWHGEWEVGLRHTDDCREYEIAMRFPGVPAYIISMVYFLSPKDALQENRRKVDEEGSAKKQENICKLPLLHPEIQASLTEDQQDHLHNRVALRFFYEHGAAICDEHPMAFFEICTCEKHAFARQKQFGLLWSLIMTDVALTINNDEYLNREGFFATCIVFQVLGEFLEARGKFELAASVYERGATLAKFPCRKGFMHNCAGLAYRRALSFDASETQLFLAMRYQLVVMPREGETDPPLLRDLRKPGLFRPALFNLLRMYIARRIRNEGSPVEPWICFLLARNGYTPDAENVSLCAMVDYYHRKILLKKLSTEKAKKCLIEVLTCSDSDAEGFRAKLLQLGKQCKSNKFSPFPIPESLIRAEKEIKSLSKTRAKDVFRADPVSTIPCAGVYCSKTSVTGEFKQCSKCKAFSYCSRECQIEHWNAGHKKECRRNA